MQLRTSILALTLVLCATVPLCAQDPSTDPQAYVHRIANVELAAHSNPVPRWRYRLEKRNASGTTTREIVETQQGLIARVLTINGRPLTPDVERNEQARLRALASDPAQLKKKLAGQDRDRQRVMKMIRALPNAFLYTYEGRSSGDFGEEVKLSFKPDPHFSPDALETQIFRSMAGTLRIAVKQQRLIELNGKLISDVSIGLGIVGKIEKGGTLLLAQSEIAPGSWEVTTLDLNVTGRALFRHLDVSVFEKATDFKPVSSKLSVAQAIDVLLSLPNGTASGAAAAAR